MLCTSFSSGLRDRGMPKRIQSFGFINCKIFKFSYSFFFEHARELRIFVLREKEWSYLCVWSHFYLFVKSMYYLKFSTWSSNILFTSYYCWMDQVSSSRGVGLIVGPAIGGYLAQVTFYCHLHRKLIFALVHKPVMILLFCLFWPYSWPRKFRGRTYLFFFQWSFTKC